MITPFPISGTYSHPDNGLFILSNLSFPCYFLPIYIYIYIHTCIYYYVQIQAGLGRVERNFQSRKNRIYPYIPTIYRRYGSKEEREGERKKKGGNVLNRCNRVLLGGNKRMAVLRRVTEIAASRRFF